MRVALRLWLTELRGRLVTDDSDAADHVTDDGVDNALCISGAQLGGALQLIKDELV